MHNSTDDEEIEKVSLLVSHWTDIVGDLVHVENANLCMSSYPIIETSFKNRNTAITLPQIAKRL